MKYVQTGSPIDALPYLAELDRLAETLPPGALAFARLPEHYDFSAEGCVKDLKLAAISFNDTGEDLQLTLNFKYNDLPSLKLQIHYTGVTSFEITTRDRNPVGPTRLGDMILDEVLPVDGGASHEMAHRGGTVLCERRCATRRQTQRRCYEL